MTTHLDTVLKKHNRGPRQYAKLLDVALLVLRCVHRHPLDVRKLLLESLDRRLNNPAGGTRWRPEVIGGAHSTLLTIVVSICK